MSIFYCPAGINSCIVSKIPPKAKTGGIWPYPTVICRNTVKSSAVPISIRPGVVYIFGGWFSCQDRGRCYIPTQPIFLRILIQNLPSPLSNPYFPPLSYKLPNFPPFHLLSNPVRNRVRKSSHLAYILATSHHPKITTFHTCLPA